MLTPWHLLAKWRPENHELFHFIGTFLDWHFWIKQSIVEKVLKTFLKTRRITKWRIITRATLAGKMATVGQHFYWSSKICSYLIYVYNGSIGFRFVYMLSKILKRRLHNCSSKKLKFVKPLLVKFCKTFACKNLSKTHFKWRTMFPCYMLFMRHTFDCRHLVDFRVTWTRAIL